MVVKPSGLNLGSMTTIAHALRRPAARRLLSRAAANLVAVIAITTIFGLKAYIDAAARPAFDGRQIASTDSRAR